MSAVRVHELQALLANEAPDAWVFVRDAYGEGRDDVYFRNVEGVESELSNGHSIALVLEARNPEEES